MSIECDAAHMHMHHFLFLVLHVPSGFYELTAEVCPPRANGIVELLLGDTELSVSICDA